MKYSELIDFEPIESVIKLREADSVDKAQHFVETFVISDRMAEQLSEVLFPNLQFEKPADNKGLLVVGNYGTGKSHLMSFISAIAEHRDMAEACRNKKVATDAKQVSGRFKVIRSEIGSTQMGLRDIICGELEDHLSAMGVTYKFPPFKEVRNNKDALAEMMSKFHAKYPDHGLLMFVDELLDYLRTRNDQEVILDLNFLREIGEVCGSLRFRFLAGVQESLVDNPRFAHVAEAMRRVKDRFEQLRIVRQDVQYVVAERLLTKDNKQRAWIREHLEKFTPLYESMAERLDEFVNLYPIHPAYLEKFEQISIAEKREVLKTLSAEMRRLLDQEVPEGETGLVSYDSYWSHLRDNVSIRSVPEVREVLDKSAVVESRIKQAFTRKAYTPMALRVCDALSVHRLTTDDVYAGIGPTASEIRDDLCLYHDALPEKSSEFLKTTVQSCLNEIVKTMSGQFIHHNKENEQYYLDLRKDIDYDTQIEKRAESLSKSELDRYYFDALKPVMVDVSQTEYVSGFKIWEHEIDWQSHRISRRGYLFFGAPNEKSTAQPPRDFYLYFMQPHEPPKKNWQDDLPDEVFFVLKRPDEAFEKALNSYSGAKAMAISAAGATKKVYLDKAEDHLKVLTKWLREHMLTAFDVVYQGVSKKMIDFLSGQKTGDMTVREIVNLVGSVAFEPSFNERYPGYPKFTTTLTSENLGSGVSDGVRFLSGGIKTQLATAVLDGLELIDNGKVRPNESRYAKSVLTKLLAKPQGQVLNRSELLKEEHAGVERELEFRLEPELFVLVLLSLVHSGDITIRLVGRETIDAAALGDAGKKPVEEFCKFKHVERPKDIPLAALVALFELVGLPEGIIRNPDTREDAIRQLHEKIAAIVDRIVTAKQIVATGLPCWGHELLSTDERKSFNQQLDELKAFLEKLQAFNTVGKLKNFTTTVDEVKAYGVGLSVVKEIESTHTLVGELTPLTSYLSTAAAVLPSGDSWTDKANKQRDEWQPQLRDGAKRSDPAFRQKLIKSIEKLKAEYQSHYLDLHKKCRLGVNEESKKNKLQKDPRFDRLSKLANISVLSHSSLTDLQSRLNGLKACYGIVASDLGADPVCHDCGYRPSDEKPGPPGAAVLDQIDNDIDKLLDTWCETILSDLRDPTVQISIDVLEPKEKKAVEKVIADDAIPEKISTDLIQGIQKALSGLSPISVSPSELLGKLSDGSATCTVEQFRKRFEDFVAEKTRGKDLDKVRIVIKREDSAG